MYEIDSAGPTLPPSSTFGHFLCNNNTFATLLSNCCGHYVEDRIRTFTLPLLL